MKTIKNYIKEALISSKNKIQKCKYFPETKKELEEIIKERIKKEGNECDLNDIDVSRINDMGKLFYDSDFNGDISEWDVSNVIDMSAMFMASKFDGDLSKWNVSKVINMYSTFWQSDFTGENGDISNWDVSRVKNIDYLFSYSKYTGDVSNWKLNKNCYKKGNSF